MKNSSSLNLIKCGGFVFPQSFVVVDSDDLSLLASNTDLLAKHLTDTVVFEFDDGVFKRSAKPSRRRHNSASRLYANYDIPAYLTTVPEVKAIVSLLTQTRCVKSLKGRFYISLFTLSGVWYIKCSSESEFKINLDNFPICSRLNRFIDFYYGTNLFMLDQSLLDLVGSDQDALSIVQFIFESIYTLDHMWKTDSCDSLKEWHLFNAIQESTLLLCRNYEIDLTAYVKSEYFGYGKGKKLKLSNTKTSIETAQETSDEKFFYGEVVNIVNGIMEA